MDAVVARHQVRERRVDVRRHRDEQVVSVLLDRFDLRVALREHIVAVVGAQAVRRVEALGACKVEAVLQVVADRKVKLLPRMRRGLDRLCAEAVRLSIEGHVAAGDFRRDRLGRLVDHRDARAALGLADDQLSRLERALEEVERDLARQVVVDDRPARLRPAVVVHPDQVARAVRLLAHRLGKLRIKQALHDAAVRQVARDVERGEVGDVAVDRAVDVAALAVEFAVVLPDLTVKRHLLAVVVAADRALHLRAEEAVLAREARRDAVERLELIDKLELRLRVAAEVRPRVDVALLGEVRALAEVRRGRHVRHRRAVAVHRARLDVVEHLFAVEAVGLDRRREPVAVRFGNLVVAGPDRHAGVMRKALRLVFRLALRLKEERIEVVRVEAAGVHEVVHQQDAVFGAVLVEAVGLVRAAAPHAEHREIRRRALADQRFIARIRRAQVERVGRHPVAALAEDARAVDLEEEIARAVLEL